jgi:8-oxo-dGTP diphosphatase
LQKSFALESARQSGCVAAVQSEFASAAEAPLRASLQTENPPPLPVVCALIVDLHGRVLLAQRPPHKHLGLKWEFPGGKVEPAETPEQALLREIREELRCDLEILSALPRFTHAYPSVTIEMIPFVCRLAAGSGAPQALEHVGLAWVPAHELSTYDLAPADLPLLPSLQHLGPVR